MKDGDEPLWFVSIFVIKKTAIPFEEMAGRV